MISFTEARSIVKKASEKLVLEMEVLSLEKCVGRVCAVDIESKLNIQPFDNSAMDGYAVRIADLQNACQSAPQALKMTQVVAAGSKAPPEAVESGTCAHVMTGAPVPEGAGAVVPVERVETRGENVIFTSVPQHHANIRAAMPGVERNRRQKPDTDKIRFPSPGQ